MAGRSWNRTRKRCTRFIAGRRPSGIWLHWLRRKMGCCASMNAWPIPSRVGEAIREKRKWRSGNYWILIPDSSRNFSCMKPNQAIVTLPPCAHGWWRSREGRLFMDQPRFKYSTKCWRKNCAVIRQLIIWSAMFCIGLDLARNVTWTIAPATLYLLLVGFWVQNSGRNSVSLFWQMARR